MIEKYYASIVGLDLKPHEDKQNFVKIMEYLVIKKNDKPIKES